jgi:hypothetical protein
MSTALSESRITNRGLFYILFCADAATIILANAITILTSTISRRL